MASSSRRSRCRDSSSSCEERSGFEADFPIAALPFRNEVVVHVGVDSVKEKLALRLKQKTGIRFSATLPKNYWEEIAGERRETRFTAGRAVHRWIPVTGRRHEAWDCAVYAWAIRRLIQGDPVRRADELRGVAATSAAPAVQRIKWLQGQG